MKCLECNENADNFQFCTKHRRQRKLSAAIRTLLADEEFIRVLTTQYEMSHSDSDHLKESTKKMKLALRKAGGLKEGEN